MALPLEVEHDRPLPNPIPVNFRRFHKKNYVKVQDWPDTVIINVVP